MSVKADYGQAVKAAIYQLDHKTTTNEAAKLFGVNPESIRHARRRKNIAHPFPRKSHCVKAAKLLICGEINIDTATETLGVKRQSLVSAVNRLGGSMMSVRENRRLYFNHGTHYYFRLRTKGKDVLKFLSKDLNVARIKRDKLEQKLGLSK
jgi:hypothetical protein